TPTPRRLWEPGDHVCLPGVLVGFPICGRRWIGPSNVIRSTCAVGAVGESVLWEKLASLTR
ncbi:MAG: hypothetical protein ACO39Q_11325, partial [Ilumatobacteraceae bacterium]